VGQPAAPIPVRKTYKLFIGGAFPRSESGRSYPVPGPDGAVLANAAQASRKDARDAVVAARKAFAGWARLCFTAVDEARLDEGIARLDRVLDAG